MIRWQEHHGGAACSPSSLALHEKLHVVTCYLKHNKKKTPRLDKNIQEKRKILWCPSYSVSSFFLVMQQLAENSPDCWTREAGLEIACSGPFLTLLGAPGFGPGGRPRDADPLGTPPIRSSLSSAVLLSLSPSSAVRLAPF